MVPNGAVYFYQNGISEGHRPHLTAPCSGQRMGLLWWSASRCWGAVVAAVVVVVVVVLVVAFAVVTTVVVVAAAPAAAAAAACCSFMLVCRQRTANTGWSPASLWLWIRLLVWCWLHGSTRGLGR